MESMLTPVLLLSFFLILITITVSLLVLRDKKTKVNVNISEPEVIQQPINNRRGRSGTARMRQRRSRGASSTENQSGIEETSVEEVEEQESQTLKDKSKKEEKKLEKRARREAENASRELKEEKSSIYARRQQKKEEEREEEERKKAAELEEFEAKRAAETAAELEKWKDLFSVETEGTVEEDVKEESQGLLNQFVEYIKKHKCVVLEDLALEFGLRAQDAVNRVQALEQMGRISGVMDDRGKFIYISIDEMKSVAEYIEEQGRISIFHLAEKSRELIDLEPREDVEEGKSLEEPWMDGEVDQVVESLLVAH